MRMMNVSRVSGERPSAAGGPPSFAAAASWRAGVGFHHGRSVPSRPPKEVGFSQGPSRPEKTTCDGRRSSNAEDLNQLLLMLAVIGGILPPNFQPWGANGRSLFNLSRSVSSNGPVLFERPPRYTRAYSRRRRPPPTESRGQWGRTPFHRRRGGVGFTI